MFGRIYPVARNGVSRVTGLGDKAPGPQFGTTSSPMTALWRARQGRQIDSQTRTYASFQPEVSQQTF